MVIKVTCFDITGHTRDELTSIRRRATVPAVGPMSDHQREAVRLLLEAFAAFVSQGLPVPIDIRAAVANLVAAGDDRQGRFAA